MNTPLLERDLAADKFGHYLKDQQSPNDNEGRIR